MDTSLVRIPVYQQLNQRLRAALAAEYRYLPVRIRFIGRDGDPTGEQLVTEIRISTE